MQKLFKLIFLQCLFLTPIVFASESNVVIESFKVVKTDLGHVTLNITGVNNSENNICIVGIAKSRNGDTQSLIESSPLGVNYENFDVSSGKFHSNIVVYSPSRTEPKRTSLLILKVSICDSPRKTIIATSQFDWEYHWEPELSEPFQVLRAKIVAKEFKSLDLLLDKWIASKERNHDGVWKLSQFKDALGSACYIRQGANWKECLKRIHHWKSVSPSTAGLAEAKYWMDYAWNIRGGRYVANNDPYAIEIFAKRMEKAKLALNEISPIKDTNPVWYELYLGIVIDMGKGKEFVSDLFNEATKKHPDYLPLYSTMVAYWPTFSKSQADWKNLDSLINTATAYTYEVDADSNYARLYSELIYSQRYSKSIFQNSFVSWSKMKKSFETIIDRYPSPNNLNRFAILACQANDKNTFLTIWPRVKKNLMPKLWPHNYSISLCKNQFIQRI